MNKVWRHDIVAIGGSAGALEPLGRLLEQLPAGLPATLFITLHIPAEFPSLLARQLGKHGSWNVREATSGEHFQSGDVLVAPPDRHLVVERSRVTLSIGPRENRHRPAIDVMFRSAARSYGPRVAAIVLSGFLDDGAAGLLAVKMRHGLTIVQDPAEAPAPEMPSRAIQYAGADYVLDMEGIARLLISVCSGDLPLPENSQESMRSQSSNQESLVQNETDDKPGKPSAFACPECHGVLWEIDDGKLLRFRCRVGHGYTADALRLAMSEAAENALWVAMRTLEEKAGLLRRMATRTSSGLAAHYREEAAGFDQHAGTIRRMLAENQIRDTLEQAAQTP